MQHERSAGAPIILVCGSYYPREGGAERQMRGILESLSRSGQTVEVYTQPEPSAMKSEVINGVRVVRAGSAHLFDRNRRLGELSFCLGSVVRILCARPRTVVSLQFGSATTASAFAAILGSRHRRVVRLTGGGSEKFSSEAYSRAATRGGRLLVKLGMVGNPTVVAPARHLLRDLEESFPAMTFRTRKIPNAVQGTDRRPAAREKSVIWYQRRGSEKSTELFLKIVSLMPDVSFTVIGADLPNAPSNVDCLGWVSDPEYEISSHHVLLNTSLREGMPNTALQAISQGTRVVGFANAGITELAEEFPTLVDIVEEFTAENYCRTLELVLRKPPGRVQAVATYDEVEQIWRDILL